MRRDPRPHESLAVQLCFIQGRGLGKDCRRWLLLLAESKEGALGRRLLLLCGDPCALALQPCGLSLRGRELQQANALQQAFELAQRADIDAERLGEQVGLGERDLARSCERHQTAAQRRLGHCVVQIIVAAGVRRACSWPGPVDRIALLRAGRGRRRRRSRGHRDGVGRGRERLARLLLLLLRLLSVRQLCRAHQWHVRVVNITHSCVRTATAE